MTGVAFWQLVDRLRIPDAKALEFIGYPGKLPASGKRPRFRLTTLQTRRASFLPEIENALGAIGEDPSWLRRRIRTAPFSGRTPVDVMADNDGAGLAVVVRHLNRAALRKAVR